MNKSCNKCSKSLPLNAFKKDFKIKGKISSICRSCVNIERERWRLQNLEEIKKLRYEDIIKMKRTCNTCSIEKPLLEYSINNAKKLGREYICKLCIKEKIKSRDKEKIKIYAISRIEKLKSKKICTNCAKFPALEKDIFCETCFFKKKSTVYFNTVDLGPKLKEKFECQNKKCWYSKVPLVLGENASLDHMKSRANHPELSKDINNLVWCDMQINFMKRELNTDEFFEIIRRIYKESNL